MFKGTPFRKHRRIKSKPTTIKSDMDADENNFTLEVREHKIEMQNGQLYIDDVFYEDDVSSNSPQHDLVREIFVLRQQVAELERDVPKGIYE